MTREDLDKVLGSGPQVGPTRAELLAAVDQAGNPMAEGFSGRVLAGLPRQYSAAEIAAALDGLAEVRMADGGVA